MRAIILGATIAAAFAGQACAVEAEFKDWWAACDNTRVCTAFGFADDANWDTPAYLKLTREAGPEDAPMVEIVGQMTASPWRLQVDGKPVPGVPTLTPKDERANLDAGQSAALIKAVANGAKLEVVAGDATAPISLAGSSAALRWLDDQQRRAGTLTALVAKGAKPAKVVPAAPVEPLIRAAAPVSQAKLPTALPKSVRAFVECDEGILDREGFEPVIARLSPGVVLYAPVCSLGAYNMIHTFVLADDVGRNPRALIFTYANGEQAGPDLMNIDFDPATQTLNNFEKGRGLSDCGSANTWVWTGKTFTPTDQSVMGVCKGVSSDDWPTVFHSRRK